MMKDKSIYFCLRPPLPASSGFLVVVLIVLCVLVAGGAGGYELARYEPAEGCYLGAYIELDHVVDGDIEAFAEMTGRPHATYFRYVGYGRPFPYKWVKELKSRGIAPHIAWEPNRGLQMVKNDEYLRGWAEAARHADVPIFLRYASEMNGTWQNYSGNPELYIQKWRIVYRVMKSVAPKVVMVWCPFATPRTTIPDYYPGDEYVDWVGVNIYSVVHQDGDLTKPPTEDPVALLRYVYDRYADTKPIAVCEYGATHFCRASQSDVTDFAVEKMKRMYKALVERFPRVRMINWFSVDAIGSSLADNNYSVTANEHVLETYRELISDPHFLSAVSGVSGAGEMVATSPGPSEPSAAEPAAPSEPVSVQHPLAASNLNDAPDDRVTIAILGTPPDRVSGSVEIGVHVPWDLDGGSVAIFIDGSFRSITNVRPYRYLWDAEEWEAGEHVIRVEVTDRYNQVCADVQASAVVIEESGG
ncbi:MAG: glycosyl hydrolase [Armatimonadota bacterium]